MKRQKHLRYYFYNGFWFYPSYHLETCNSPLYSYIYIYIYVIPHYLPLYPTTYSSSTSSPWPCCFRQTRTRNGIMRNFTWPWPAHNSCTTDKLRFKLHPHYNSNNTNNNCNMNLVDFVLYLFVSNRSQI